MQTRLLLFASVLRVFSLLIALPFLACVSAQTIYGERCGNELFFAQTIWGDTAQADRMKQNDAAIQQFLVEQGHLNIHTRGSFIIPIVVHVVWHSVAENISDYTILTQIEALNRDFSGENIDISSVPPEFQTVLAGDTGLRFGLAARDATGNPSSGIVRIQTNEPIIGISDHLYADSTGGSTAWDPNRYLNIWVANTGTLIGGFGTYPNMASPEKSGLVINPRFFGTAGSGRYNMGRTAVHELGHFLGLYHPWRDDNDCSTDDGVEDTPVQQHPYTGCPQYPQQSCGYSSQFMNYMDYVDDRCMVMFTQGQKEKMLANLSLFRPGLMDGSIPCNLNSSGQNIAFQVSPNPSNGLFTLTSLRTADHDYTVTVFNSMGQVVQEATYIRSNGQGMEIDLSQALAGIYLVVCAGAGKVHCMKVAIQH